VRDFDTKEYCSAFLSEKDKRIQQDLKDRGIKKRFACLLYCAADASKLYEILSNFYVHGGSSTRLIHSSLNPNEHSCLFHNRPGVEKTNIDIFTSGVEMMCLEIAGLYDQYGSVHHHLITTEATVATEKLHALFSPNPSKHEMEMRGNIEEILAGVGRHPNGGGVNDFETWARAKGLRRDEFTPGTPSQFFQDAGLRITEDGFPLIPGIPGRPKNCKRCGVLTEYGIRGTDNEGPHVICEDCYLLMFRDSDRFHEDGWGK
jgi:hypothetical protein